ncbi:hypothetical protein [Borreliella burgdorferi]|uniref:hypothetical protein n=1 Tax=Borreliella burgdorferi TaxID=139 RepID=UPI00016B33E0|nr:hypothetical protein [Borreliella burgdorferi]PRR20646.1 hypothetical protein CV644_05975 [Borreliella burgdorferi]PRR62695.1 hypothetical protein CV638_05870 [Borreliella burgdorferi]
MISSKRLRECKDKYRDKEGKIAEINGFLNIGSIIKNNKKNIKEDNNNTCYVDEESRLNEIKEGEVWKLFVGGYVT